MVKQKVYRAKVIPKKKREDLLKSLGSVKLNIFQIEYIYYSTIIMIRILHWHIEKVLNAKLRIVNHYY